MSTISVSLSTTRFLVQSSMPEKDETEFWLSNIPVCVAEQFTIGSELPQEMVDVFSKACLSMAKIVHVSGNDVFVGEDKDNEETGLVIYHEEVDSERTRSFFKRWGETGVMIFQFTMFNQDRAEFTIHGIWVKDHWHKIQILPRPPIMIKVKDDRNE